MITGHEVIEAALAKAAQHDAGNSPAHLSYGEALAYQMGLASAYQHALEMMPLISKEQAEAIASSIRSLRYGAHPHRSPHADHLVQLFPEVKL